MAESPQVSLWMVCPGRSAHEAQCWIEGKAPAWLSERTNALPPVVAKPQPEAAVYIFNWLSMTGTGILISALIAGKLLGASFRTMAEVYGETLIRIRYSLLTIAAMLALGYTTRYSGLDATLGLAFAMRTSRSRFVVDCNTSGRLCSKTTR
jgi:L-lactate permease